MPIERSAAVVIGRFPLGESDRVVTFFTRRFGKVRGVARSARRLRSRFGSALEPFTLGELVFFDGGKSELVQVDHFDIVRPFAAIRDDLERLGQAAWIIESVGRLTGDRDPSPALFSLVVRALAAIDTGVPPARAAVTFGVRYVDALGHRLRLDACVGCGRRHAGVGDTVALDVAGGGVLCRACAAGAGGALRVRQTTLGALARLRQASWTEATRLPLGRTEAELRVVLDAHLASLMGHGLRSARFLKAVGRVSRREDR